MNLRSSNKIKIEGAMSSMTDLVFLLLIFFVVLSTMISAGHNIELPSSKNATTKEKSNTKVFVTKDNQYFLGENDKTPLSLENLESSILQSLSKDSTIELLGDKKASWEYSVRVIDVAKRNGLKIIIKTKNN